MGEWVVEQMLGAGASWALLRAGLGRRRTRAGAAGEVSGCPRQITGGAAGPLPGDELLCRPARGGLRGRKGQTIISLSLAAGEGMGEVSMTHRQAEGGQPPTYPQRGRAPVGPTASTHSSRQRGTAQGSCSARSCSAGDPHPQIICWHSPGTDLQALCGALRAFLP